MKPIEGWDEAPAYTGEIEALPAGKYVCEIINAEEQTDRNGRRLLVLMFDIAEGEFKGYYGRMFDAAKKNRAETAAWKGIYRQQTHGNSLPFFKGMIKSIVKSNPGYTWEWKEKSLVRKKFGGVFGREQFLGSDGEPHWATKCLQIRSLDGLKDAKVPEDKPLENRPVSGHPYIGQPSSAAASQGFMAIPDGVEDEGLPFN